MYSKDDFYLNPNLRSNYDLLMNCFLEDASFIVFFDVNDITKSIEESALKRGFSVSLKDLEMNPGLRNVSFIMKKAISSDPSMIRYIGKSCYLDSDFVLDTLKKYSITISDLFDNPDICFNVFVMKFLHQYKLYRGYLKKGEKIDYVSSTLKNGESITNLPFLYKRFGSLVDSSLLEELYDVLRIDASEDDIDFQEECFNKLDKFIDALVSNKYSSSRFKYSSIDDVNKSMLYAFDKSLVLKNYSSIVDIINDISSFIGGSNQFVQKNVLDFYTSFLCTGSLDLSLTSNFCNSVLNRHRSSYLSNYKRMYSKTLYSKFYLSSKKRNLIYNSIKLRLITNYIRNSKYDLLGVSSIDGIVSDVCSDIISNKYIIKSGIDLSCIDSLGEIFKRNGSLEVSDVSSILGCPNNDVCKFIVKKFHNIKLGFLNNIVLSDDYMGISLHEKSLIGFNYNNFNIYDDDKYFSNIASVLVSIDETSLRKILKNRNIISSIKWLVLFIDLFPEFDVSDFISVMSSFDVVSEKIKSVSSGDIIDNLADLFSLSSSYSSCGNLEASVLGDEFISTIGNMAIKLYVDYYLRILKREESHIPSVSFSMDGFSFESGVYGDIDRLLIGYNVSGSSCIHIGSKTFDEVLLGDNGDVILVRDSDNNVVSRIFVFRSGSVIQLVSNLNTKYSIDVYKEISRLIIDKAKAFGDNIDFVCVNSLSCVDSNSYDMLDDNRFITLFPHADVFSRVIVLYSNGVMDFDSTPKCFYPKVRCGVNYNSSDFVITRLRALDVILESDPLIKEEKRSKFVPFFSKEYRSVVNGEDWYIALRNDGVLEELALPISYECYDEMDSVRDKVLDIGLHF